MTASFNTNVPIRTREQTKFIKSHPGSLGDKEAQLNRYTRHVALRDLQVKRYSNKTSFVPLILDTPKSSRRYHRPKFSNGAMVKYSIEYNIIPSVIPQSGVRGR